METLRLAARRPGSFFTDAEALQELLHRYFALRRWPEGKRVVLDFADLMSGSVEPIAAEDMVLACDLAARDLLHAAVMIRAEGSPSTIVTADGDFEDLAPEGIERLDPANIEDWRRGIEGDRT